MFFLLYRTTDSWPAELRQDLDITKVKPIDMTVWERKRIEVTNKLYHTVQNTDTSQSAKETFNKVHITSVSNFVILTSLFGFEALTNENLNIHAFCIVADKR